MYDPLLQPLKSVGTVGMSHHTDLFIYNYYYCMYVHRFVCSQAKACMPQCACGSQRVAVGIDLGHSGLKSKYFNPMDHLKGPGDFFSTFTFPPCLEFIDKGQELFCVFWDCLCTA